MNDPLWLFPDEICKRWHSDFESLPLIMASLHGCIHMIDTEIDRALDRIQALRDERSEHVGYIESIVKQYEKAREALREDPMPSR